MLREAGGELVLGWSIGHLHELPSAHAYVLDVTPRQLLAIAGDALTAAYRRGLSRFRYGPGVFKVDWALSAPVPWRHPECARAGDLADLSAAEAAPHAGRVAERPFVLFVQPTLVDASRAPAGMHVAWAYCHVPHGARVDATAAIEAQVERFAPGFRDLVLARATPDPAALEAHDANYVGGDINGGLADLRQLFFRPMPRPDLRDVRTARLLVLVVDAAGRRRARHVWLVGRAERAPARFGR